MNVNVGCLPLSLSYCSVFTSYRMSKTETSNKWEPMNTLTMKTHNPTNEMNYTLSKTKAKKKIICTCSLDQSVVLIYISKCVFFFSVLFLFLCQIWICVRSLFLFRSSFRALRGHSIDYTQTAITTAKRLDSLDSLSSILFCSLSLLFSLYLLLSACDCARVTKTTTPTTTPIIRTSVTISPTNRQPRFILTIPLLGTPRNTFII